METGKHIQNMSCEQEKSNLAAACAYNGLGN